MHLEIIDNGIPTSGGKRPFLQLSQADIREFCQRLGQSAFRADQIRRWVFPQRVVSFDEMTNLPQSLRNELATKFDLFPAELQAHQTASDRTEKLLLKLADGQTVECVLMRETGRRTLCISTQVGCAMGCVFCASGLLGLKRHLTKAEILEQILRLDRLLPETGRITNIVVMGIGEPLHNLEALLPALEEVRSETGLGLGARRITISTVGLPEKMRALAETGVPYNLAVSLHAPNDALRNELVPVNKSIGIEAIFAAADDYFTTTGRRVTWEYVLLSGVNDQPDHARELADRLQGRVAHVNLIPMNSVEELPFCDPQAPQTEAFAKILQSAQIPVTIRKRKGADIDAACGQLRLNHAKAASSA